MVSTTTLDLSLQLIMIACDLLVFVFSLLASIQSLTSKSSLLHKASNLFRLSEEYSYRLIQVVTALIELGVQESMSKR